MFGKCFLMVLIAMFAGAQAMAQEDSVENETIPCHVQPVFHCTQALGDGTAIGHFGYSYTCSDGSQPELETYIEIGEENRMTPGAEDRGQSKVFSPGEHIDIFETEFTPEEIEKGINLVWTVRDRTARVSYTRTRDASLDCSKLP